MVMVKMLTKIDPPKVRGLLVMTMASISPSRRELFPAESLRRRAKVLLPMFCLKTAVLLLKVLSSFFSRPKDLMYQKLGTGGGPGSPLPTRARHEGVACPGA